MGPSGSVRESRLPRAMVAYLYCSEAAAGFLLLTLCSPEIFCHNGFFYYSVK